MNHVDNGQSRGQKPDPLLRENVYRLPDYAYVETSGGVLLGALGTKVSDGRYEAFPLHASIPPPGTRTAGRTYRKVWKTDLVCSTNPATISSADGSADPRLGKLMSSSPGAGPHGLLLSGDSITRIWLPTLSVDEAAQFDSEIRQHRSIIARVEEEMGDEAFIVGSRSFGLGVASSDIDVLFRGITSYQRFAARAHVIMERAGLEFRSRSDLHDVAERYTRFYRIPTWVAPSIWTQRFTKVRSRWLRLGFHFTHAYQTDVWPEFEELTSGTQVMCSGTVIECDHSAFMPRRYRVVVGNSQVTVLTKMFLYAGMANVGDRVEICGTRTESGVVVLGNYGDYIAMRGL